MNNGMCIPIYIYIFYAHPHAFYTFHGVKGMYFHKESHCALFVLVLAASWTKIKINDQHEFLTLK